MAEGEDRTAPSARRLAASAETGGLGVAHLKRLWSRAARPGEHASWAAADEFTLDKIVLYGLGVGLREAMAMLARDVSLAEFEGWILEVNGGALDPAGVRRINDAVARLTGGAADPGLVLPDPAPVLSAEELAHWQREGYVVLRDAVDTAARGAAEQAIWQSLDADPGDSENWYGGPQGHSIWLPLIHHPALQAIRRAQRIHGAFAQLWGTGDLWATIDRAGFNPPERERWRFPGPHLHWDASLAPPMPLGIQGILYLTDTEAEQGAFTCVPGFHHRLAQWLEQLPPGADPRAPERMASLGAVPIAGRAGDLILWHHALPHGSRPNRARRPRLVQYISMFPTAFRDDRPWV